MFRKSLEGCYLSSLQKNILPIPIHIHLYGYHTLTKNYRPFCCSPHIPKLLWFHFRSTAIYIYHQRPSVSPYSPWLLYVDDLKLFPYVAPPVDCMSLRLNLVKFPGAQ